MRFPLLTSEEVTRHYDNATNTLVEVAHTYYLLGRLADARHLLSTSLQLLAADETTSQQQLRLLLLYGQVLVVSHLLMRGDADLLFSTIQQAKQIAETVQDQQSNADVLSLLGQAHYFTTVTARLQSNASPDAPQSTEIYAQALAYQQQALALREALQDTRGISESSFQIGTIYERWQQYDPALAYYRKARHLADQYDHPFEKTEPARHFALDALRRGDLDQALAFAQEALALREAAQFKPYQPLDHLLLRSVYLAKGDTANAQRHFEIASALAEELGLHTLISSLPDIRALLREEHDQGNA